LYRNGILDPQGVAYVSRSGAIAFGMPSNNPELRVEYAYMPRWNMVCDLNIVRFYRFPGFAVATHTDGWVPIDGAKSHDPHLSVTHTGAWSRIQFAGMQGETTRIETPFSADPSLARVAAHTGRIGDR
jgi:hypothetical protein